MASRRSLSAGLAAHPGWSAALVVAVTCILGWQISGLDTRYEVEDFFATDTPDRRVFDTYRESFGRDDRTALMIIESTAPHGLEDMRHIAALVKRLEARPDIEAVVAPTSALIAVRGPDEVVQLEPAVPDDALTGGDTARLELARARLSQRPYVNQVLSTNGRIAVVAAFISPEYLDNQARRTLTRALEAERARVLKERDWAIHLAGYPVHRVYLTEHVNAESRGLLPVALAVIVVILLVVFRRLTAVLLPLGVAAISIVWCLGLMSLLGIATNILAPGLFILVVLVSVADAIHFMALSTELRRKGVARADVARDVLQTLLMPCLLTSLTTAVVFAGLGLTGIPMIADFGLGVAVGVICAFVVTVLLAPPAFALQTRGHHTAKPQQRSGLAGRLEHLDEILSRHPKRVLASSVALLLVFGVGMLLIEPNSPLLADLEPDHPVQQTNRFIESQLGGVIPLDVMIQPPPGDPARSYSIERMRKIDALTSDLRALPEVLNATSPVDILRQLQPVLERVPESEAASLVPAALLLAYEQITPWVDDAGHVIRIQMRIANLDTDEALALFDTVRTLYAKHLGDDSGQMSLTGQGYLGQTINNTLVDHFKWSFVVGLVVVFVVIMVVFATPRLAAVALLPNLFPLVVVAGVMGFAGIELRYTSALVLSVVFGLAVDDTIHTLARLRVHRASPDPIATAVRTAGVGIVWTSVILAAGFITLTASDFLPNQILGLLLALTAVAALWGDLVLLPAMLRLLVTRRTANGKAPRLKPLIVPTSQLSEPTIDRLYALFKDSYENTDRTRFAQDLAKKQYVIVLRVRGLGPIQGFSTIRVFDVENDGRKFKVLFSGDTVVARAFWGQNALHTGFTLFMFRLRFRTLSQPVFWLLTTKGYKTYLLMTNYFAQAWPRHDQQTPALVAALRRQLGALLFGTRYDPETGVAQLGGTRDRVRGGLCDISEKDLENAHIRHFAQLNPGHAEGDELVCLAQIRFRDPLLIYTQIVKKSLRKASPRRR